MSTPDQSLIIPPAEPRYPDCSVCGHELTSEGDDLYCDECRIGWPMERFHLENGHRLDDTPICGAEIAPFGALPDYRYRCIREEGHDSEHAGVLVGRFDAFNCSHTWRNVRPDRQQIVTVELPGGAA